MGKAKEEQEVGGEKRDAQKKAVIASTMQVTTVKMRRARQTLISTL